MFGHQLPATPPLDDFLTRLPEAIAGRPGEILVAERSIRTWGVAAPLEAICYADASHLLVTFRYHGALRQVEPYSLRRPRTGNLLLYGFEQSKNGVSTNDIRPYNVAEMQDVRIINR